MTKPMNFDAVIFDLDGVVTDTAKVHAGAWKFLFDDFLRKRAIEYNETFLPFDFKKDYSCYLDGKPRHEGIRSFLRSRKIVLAEGNPRDKSNLQTVYGLGKRKDDIFLQDISKNGVDVFDSSVTLIQNFFRIGLRQAIASSSKNCQTILKVTGLEDYFGVRVDGIVSEELTLEGKPAPDIFLKCAELFCLPPERIVVVEDAISGVQAGRRGGFGLVIGIDRIGIGKKLQENGADIVIDDLLNVSPDDIDLWQYEKRFISEQTSKTLRLHVS